MISLALAALLLAGPARAETFRVVADDSSILFTVRHMAGHVTGRFERFTGSFDYEPGKPGLWKASAAIDASSLNTTSALRDEHLRGPDFFDASRCPTISFAGKKARPLGRGRYALDGTLSVRCLSRPVTLTLEPGPSGRDERGEWRSFRAKAALNRRDFGMTWVKPLNALFIGDEVEATLEIQGLHDETAARQARR